MLPFMQWLQSIGFLTGIRESALVYPVIMTSHLSGMALFGGMILLTDIRLLGWGLTKYSIGDVVDGLRLWKRIGGAFTMTAGLLLGSAEAEKYYGNPFFWLKMVLLVGVAIHALVFRPTVYNNTAELDKSPVIPRRAKAAAAISLVLWIGLVSAGRLIGYYEGPQAVRTEAAR